MNPPNIGASGGVLPHSIFALCAGMLIIQIRAPTPLPITIANSSATVSPLESNDTHYKYRCMRNWTGLFLVGCFLYMETSNQPNTPTYLFLHKSKPRWRRRTYAELCSCLCADKLHAFLPGGWVCLPATIFSLLHAVMRNVPEMTNCSI